MKLSPETVSICVDLVTASITRDIETKDATVDDLKPFFRAADELAAIGNGNGTPTERAPRKPRRKRGLPAATTEAS